MSLAARLRHERARGNAAEKQEYNDTTHNA